VVSSCHVTDHGETTRSSSIYPADVATAGDRNVMHLSLVTGSSLVDGSGLRLGRVEDLIVRLGADHYPPVTGVLATVAGRGVFVPAEAIRDIASGRVALRESRLDLQPFERRPQEVLLKEDVLDHQLINIDGARLVRTNDIEIARVEGWYRVVGVDTSARGFLRRLVPRRIAPSIGARTLLDWASVEPFTGHVPTVRLRIPHPKLARLHPAEVADLVEAASHREGEEILAAVGADADREADVFEELDPQHQVEFIEERSDEDAAALLARMESDDAADLINGLDEGRREEIVALLPGVQQRRVRSLLGYDPTTAGGLMSPDFICIYSQASRQEVLERIGRATGPAEALAWVFVMNQRQRLKGAIQVVDLIRADPDLTAGEIAEPVRTVLANADLEEVARLMTDFDLTVVPVVDDDQRIIGVITVDDVLEIVLPRGWRRTFRVFGDD
jgi:CBS domain-containing protein